MNKALTLATVLFLGVVGQAAAQGAVCPIRDKGEAAKTFNGRTHDYCEVRWSDLVAARQTGDQTHDGFINVCSRNCAGNLGASTAGSQLAPLGYALAATGVGGVIAGAVETTASHGAPASP